jgi:superfamily II DNA helicase RecQ
MHMRFFTIPASAADAAADELNSFLNSCRVLSLDRQFVADGAGSFWAVCVSYLPSKGPEQSPKRAKIDYKEVLGPEDFALFARLRILRKTIAEKEGVPVYAVFTNEQLACMVERRVSTQAAMGDIAGIGAGRIEKYGEVFLKELRPTPEDGPLLAERVQIEA